MTLSTSVTKGARRERNEKGVGEQNKPMLTAVFSAMETNKHLFIRQQTVKTTANT